jgi:hypothetical protein
MLGFAAATLQHLIYAFVGHWDEQNVLALPHLHASLYYCEPDGCNASARAWHTLPDVMPTSICVATITDRQSGLNMIPFIGMVTW